MKLTEEIYEIVLGIRALSRKLKDLLIGRCHLCSHFRRDGDFVARKKIGKIMVS